MNSHEIASWLVFINAWKCAWLTFQSGDVGVVPLFYMKKLRLREIQEASQLITYLWREREAGPCAPVCQPSTCLHLLASGSQSVWRGVQDALRLLRGRLT